MCIRAEQNSSCEEVLIRISKAVKVYKALYHPLWKRKQVSLETKMAIYRAAVLPVLLYGSETWVMTAVESQRLEVFQMKCLRGILGITKFDHKRNEDILAETKQCLVGELVTRARLRWLGHVARMDVTRLPPRLLFGKVDGKAKAGRPVSRWKDMIEIDLKKRGVKNNWFNAVHDRATWRKIVHGDTGGLVIRAQRNRMEEKGVELVAIEKLGLVCPTCGKGYRSNKGGWYVKHVEACGGGIVKAAVVQPEEVVGELKCPKCGKQYRSNAGGWFKKHIDTCGPSQPL